MKNLEIILFGLGIVIYCVIHALLYGSATIENAQTYILIMIMIKLISIGEKR